MGTFTAFALLGCASHHPKVPSYEDRDLRPINQDLVAWLDRLNVDQPSQKPASAAPEGAKALPGGGAEASIGGVSANLRPPSSGDPAQAGGSPPKPDQTHALPAAPVAARLASGQAKLCPIPLPAGTVAPPGDSSAWSVPAGTSFCQALVQWTTRVNWTLVWDAPTNGPTLPALAVAGDLKDAIRALQKAVTPAGTHSPLRVEIYRNATIHVTNRN